MSKFIPNSFQVPNALVDALLYQMSDAALRVYIIIIRKTRGWHKESDRISLSQFQAIGGRSRHTVIAGLSELESLGLVTKTDTEKGSVWALTDGQASANNAPVEGSAKSALVQNMHQPSAKSAPVASAKSAHTKDTITKDTNKRQESVTPPAIKWLKELGCDDQIASDFLAHRKAKGAAVTKTVITIIVNQAEKAGISFAQAIEITIARDWKSFNATWKWQDDQPTQSQQPVQRQTETPKPATNLHVALAGLELTLFKELKKSDPSLTEGGIAARAKTEGISVFDLLTRMKRSAA